MMRRIAQTLRRLLSSGQSSLSSESVRCCPNLFQVWGANTDVGKSILSAGILRSLNAPTLYIKPVQTGYPSSDDSAFVSHNAHLAKVCTISSYSSPVSPDLAVELDTQAPIPDKEICNSISKLIEAYYESSSAEQSETLGLIETAGGVLSPLPSGNLQADVYRMFRYPSLLVGDSRLGGISSTIASYEALRIRGYKVPVIVTFPEHDSSLENHRSIEQNIDSNQTTVLCAPELPNAENSLQSYFEMDDVQEFFSNLSEHIRYGQQCSVRELEEMHKNAHNIFWYPFTQHKTLQGITSIDSAFEDNYTCFDPERGLHHVADAFGSWWTTGVGHGNIKVARAIGEAAGRYGHVMLPEATHENAYKLASAMLNGPGKRWASRVFFSDNGSTAVEVGLKMAFRKRSADFPERSHLEKKIIALDGCYHGDTLGAMDCAPRSDYNSKQTPWYSPRGVYFKPPTIALVDGVWSLAIPEAMAAKMPKELGSTEKSHGQIGAGRLVETFPSKVEIFDMRRDGHIYVRFIRSILDNASQNGSFDLGALLLEPIVQGAGGMKLVDPAFQRALIRESRNRGIPVIFDEVFSGIWRLGVETGADLLGEYPDVASYGKLLTGGVIPLSVTLASSSVFEVFLGETKHEALLHGHSYTGHPIGCAAAVESLKQYKALWAKASERGSPIQYWDECLAKEISYLPGVVSCTEIGTVLSVELEAEGGSGYAATGARELAKRLRNENILTRPLGNVLYILASPMSSESTCQELSKALHKNILSLQESLAVES